MAGISCFEDLNAWKKARLLTRLIYRVSAEGQFRRDFSLRDQIRRASISAMSNIAEGFDRNGNPEFRRFLTYAKGSTGEVKSQLYVALDAGFISDEVFEEAYESADEVSRLISGMLKHLAGFRK